MKRLIDKFRKNEFWKNVATLVSAIGLAQAISLLIYPVLTRIYTPAEHGLLSLYLSIVALSAIVATGKYELAVMLPKKEKDGAALTLLSLTLSFIFSLLLLIFIACFRSSIPRWLGNEDIASWLWFIPLSTFLISIFQVSSYWFNRRKNYRIIARSNLGQSLVNSAVKLSSSTYLARGGGLVAGAITGQIAGALLFFIRLKREGLAVFTGIPLKQIRELAWEYRFFPRFSLAHKVINNFSGALPVFAFSQWFSATEVGFFGLGFMLVNRPMNLIATSLTKVFSQQIIEWHNQGRIIHLQVRRFIGRMAWMALIPAIILLVFGPWLVALIFGSEWREAGEYMRILTPWLYLAFLNMPLIFLGDMLGRQQKAMWLEVIRFMLRIGALAIGIYLDSVLLALLLFSAVSMLMLTYSLFWYLALAKKSDDGKR